MEQPAASTAGSEDAIAAFYESFPYPSRPMYFEAIDDPEFYSAMIRQEVGGAGVGPFDTIWVAGCGTNQALITALKHPRASVIGTDVSGASLEICAENAKKLRISNLTLAECGITQFRRSRQFDLIICTGVIHHNRAPRQCLMNLAEALRDDGVLELMVYNKFHRREISAFQEAVRILLPDDLSHKDRLTRARSLARSITATSELTRYLEDTEEAPDPPWADIWINPFEKSYDVESLWSLAEECELSVETPHLNALDKASNRFLWTLEIADPALSDTFLSLDDRRRWQLVNLLRLDASPMLWFYLRPNRDKRHIRQSDAGRNERFLDCVLQKPSAVRRRYFLSDSGEYELQAQVAPVSSWRPRSEVQELWANADGRRTGADIFRLINRDLGFNSIYKARIMLTVAEFPHLMMCG